MRMLSGRYKLANITLQKRSSSSINTKRLNKNTKTKAPLVDMTGGRGEKLTYDIINSGPPSILGWKWKIKDREICFLQIGYLCHFWESWEPPSLGRRWPKWGSLFWIKNSPWHHKRVSLRWQIDQSRGKAYTNKGRRPLQGERSWGSPADEGWMGASFPWNQDSEKLFSPRDVEPDLLDVCGCLSLTALLQCPSAPWKVCGLLCSRCSSHFDVGCLHPRCPPLPTLPNLRDPRPGTFNSNVCFFLLIFHFLAKKINSQLSCWMKWGICQYRCFGNTHKIGSCGAPFLKCCKR